MKKMKPSTKQVLWTLLIIVMVMAGSFSVQADTPISQKISDRETSFYRDFWDQVFCYPFSKFLRWDRFLSHHIGKEALNINVYDEVPDSSFFENRHGKELMSTSALSREPSDAKPDHGPWQVINGKSDGYTAGFFIKDKKGDKYLLKFDPPDNPEMATGAETIAHHFFHAFGYHVPSYSIVYFDTDILEPAPEATYYDHRGFKMALDRKAILDILQKAPKMKRGRYRAVASKLLDGTAKGYWDFEGRRYQDPEDRIRHEDRREVRALQVFGAFVNNYDLRTGNTLDMVVTEKGRTFLKHYLIDFGSSFGSAGYQVKHPPVTHESVIDFGAITKAFFKFKTKDENWEKRWDANQRRIQFPSIGYFDNRQFEPSRWKSQLMNEAFERVTEADGYWAAKIISRFDDSMIRALVKTGEFSNPEAESYLVNMLIERRNVLTRFWFKQVVPIEEITLKNNGGDQYELSFQDLAVIASFERSNAVQYRLRIGKGDWQTFQGNSVRFRLAPDQTKVKLKIERRSAGESNWTKLPIQIDLESKKTDQTYQIARIHRGRS